MGIHTFELCKNIKCLEELQDIKSKFCFNVNNENVRYCKIDEVSGVRICLIEKSHFAAFKLIINPSVLLGNSDEYASAGAKFDYKIVVEIIIKIIELFDIGMNIEDFHLSRIDLCHDHTFKYKGANYNNKLVHEYIRVLKKDKLPEQWGRSVPTRFGDDLFQIDTRDFALAVYNKSAEIQNNHGKANADGHCVLRTELRLYARGISEYIDFSEKSKLAVCLHYFGAHCNEILRNFVDDNIPAWRYVTEERIKRAIDTSCFNTKIKQRLNKFTALLNQNPSQCVSELLDALCLSKSEKSTLIKCFRSLNNSPVVTNGINRPLLPLIRLIGG
ncbi:MAG: hypothetical protein QM689_12520 [Oscillospiraceae bacterium]